MLDSDTITKPELEALMNSRAQAAQTIVDIAYPDLDFMVNLDQIT